MSKTIDIEQITSDGDYWVRFSNGVTLHVYPRKNANSALQAATSAPFIGSLNNLRGVARVAGGSTVRQAALAVFGANSRKVEMHRPGQDVPWSSEI